METRFAKPPISTNWRPKGPASRKHTAREPIAGHRASFMSGYYPHATGVLGYKVPRPAIGNRTTWSQHFRNHGYHAARVSKIYHMGVPGGIESGGDGSDDPLSWDEKYNSKGPEWRAPGDGETLQKNQTAKDRLSEETPLSSWKRMETILCIRTGRQRKRPSSYLRNTSLWKNLFGSGWVLCDPMFPS